MKKTILLVLAAVLVSFVAGCSGEGGTGQEAFYHNNREHSQWVANPSHTPKYTNPATGGPMFY